MFKGLVLSGGGARGAYQVGVLSAIAHVCKEEGIVSPFQIYTGVSAGAINSTYMASGAENFTGTAQKLVELWSGLTSDKVFRTDALSLGRIGLSWVGELSFGGIAGASHGKSLLDTSPLGDLLRENINFHKIEDNIKSGVLRALAISTLDYRNNSTVTFVQGNDECKMWERVKRRSQRTSILAHHVLASSAIPMLFPPVQINDSYHGDGCVRNQAPMSPSIHLGAKKLFVVGVRKQDTLADLKAAEKPLPAPSVARVVNVLLNSVLLDGVEYDVERLLRINEFLKSVPAEHAEKINFKPMEIVWIHPSVDIGALAAQMASRLPRLIRYLLKGLGPLDDAAEIISYLLFEKEYCHKLIEIGYQDGMNQIEKIRRFIVS